MSNNIKEIVLGQVLVDLNSKGKERPWRKHKIHNMRLRESFERIKVKQANAYKANKQAYYAKNPSPNLEDTKKRLKELKRKSKINYGKRAENAVQCGTHLTFSLHEDKLKLKQAKFCQIRLCPMCAWRKSRKLALNVGKVTQAIFEDGYRLLMLTLTVQNVYGNELSATITKINKAFNRMTDYKRFKDNVVGYVRVLEITHDVKDQITNQMYAKSYEHYNKKGLGIGNKNPNFDKYHPHFHILLAVPKKYFHKPEFYITQAEFASMWQKALKVNYTPMVDIRAFKGRTKAEIAKSIQEVAKYVTKSGDYLIGYYDADGILWADKVDKRMTDDAVKIYSDALHKRKLVGWGGVFDEKRKELDIEEEVKAEVNIDDEAVAAEEEELLLTYKWFPAGYGCNYRLIGTNKPELESKYIIDPETKEIINTETGEVMDTE